VLPFSLYFLTNVNPLESEISLLQEAFKDFSDKYYIGSASLGWSHSFFNGFKTLILLLDKIFIFQNLNSLLSLSLKIYYILGALLGLLILIQKNKLSQTNLFLLLIYYYLLIPPSGAEYTLLFLILSIPYYFESYEIGKLEAVLLILILIPASNSLNSYTEVIAVFKSILISYLILKQLRRSFSKQLEAV